ncbi:bifunctional folylpolyglutamate synthase/dihydrofolate synthase [Flavobacteriaceae bacterium]|jgi:dihydrofolate synthase / folylpolyglutamate synthase|nr:bifunctional folylpolyglutamate synthase/dihydrofolate synthase [Flavobacteriaceae bacterium]MDB4063820.1 bifunctional folylpolyglutamate synthase/dihydrofolate synthase [Flavobacteriaceae bacterium]MDB4255632.1 bifunctional folylpolyglutamate synthase/dihydrofolate synthase [Flavobacteriaceae bacterium]MDC0000726.1 bifunctional folylpolyglutamate synthase/dihydrofolate synthase [Flavobacteriaceae bacterium]
MSYQEILQWMFSKLPMYQRKGAAAYRPGLDAMLALDSYLGLPHKSFKCIHVAGTNGKGSTSHMLASVLQQAGYKVGLYTSPHLLDFRERIKVNGSMIPEQKVVDFISIHKSYFEAQRLSFFEMTVGMAFSYFKQERVDYAIIEVGLGGRLDATNIITPILSVITNIGLDHTQFLGTTRPKIAREKAGIIKNGVPVVVGEKDAETEYIFDEIAIEKKSPLVYAERISSEYLTDLKGSYQQLNVQTVIAALGFLSIKNITPDIIQKGLLNVVLNTQLSGRWQILNTSPKIIADVGHNKEGLFFLSKQLQEESFKKLHIIMGFVKGRKIPSLLSLFPEDASYYLSCPNLERGLPVKELKNSLISEKRSIQYYNSLSLAYEATLKHAGGKDLIFICGSTFVVAEILSYLNKSKF